MPLVHLPALSPLALNPEKVIAVRPHPAGCELVMDAARSLLSSLTAADAATRLGLDFRPVRLDDPAAGVIRAYLNRKLVSDVERDPEGSSQLCFVSAAGIRYPVTGSLDVVAGLFA